MSPLARLAAAVCATVALPVTAFAGPAWATEEVSAVPECAEPVAVMDYDAGALTYSMQVDLTGCDWWTGGDINLTGSLDRTFAGQTEGVAVGSGCASASAEPVGGTAPDSDPIRECDIEIVLEHPSTELARYAGEITYPGPNGNESQRFRAWCGTVAGLSGCLPEE